MHAFIEDFFHGVRTLQEIPEDNEELKYFRTLHEDVLKHHTPYRAEMLVYTDAKTKVAGSIDMLFVHAEKMKHLWASGTTPTTLHLVMYDWKRSKKKLAKQYNAFQQALWPLHHLMDTDLNKYTLQQNLYK